MAGRLGVRTPPRIDRYPVVATWIDGLIYLSKEHSPQLAKRGEAYRKAISEFIYDSEEGAFYCRCIGRNRREYSIHLFVSTDGQKLVDATCTCPYGGGFDFCKHTYAAIQNLLEELNTPDSKAVIALLGYDPTQAWKQTIAELDMFLEEPAHQAAASDLRIAWRIGTDGPKLELMPYEQKRRKSGRGWTKGRKVSWDRFRKESDLWVTPVDRQIVELVKEFREETGPYYFSYRTYWSIDAFAAIEHLIGHSLVVWGDGPKADQPVAVCRGELGVAVESYDDDLYLKPAIDGRPFDQYSRCFIHSQRGAVGADWENDRLVLAPSEPKLIALVKSIADQYPVIPRDGHEDLLSRLSKLEQKLPVRLPSTLLGRTHPADERIYLRLTRSQPAGVTAEIQVRPAPEGARCKPGDGPVELTGMLDDQRVRVERNLGNELARAQAVVDALPLPPAQRVDDWRWNLAGNDEALDLLSAARQFPPEELAVEWSEDEARPMEVLGEVTPESLDLEIKKQRDWFGLEGTIEIGGYSFPVSALITALSSGGRYLELADGQWAEISQEFLERLWALEDILHRNRGKLQFNATAAPVLADLADDQVAVKAAKSWKETVKRMEQALTLDPHPPLSFTAELRDYQLEGYRWLRRLAAWGVGGCLADDMGLGKTIQALAILVDRMEDGPALVVAPTSVGFNWVRETHRFAPTLTPTQFRDTDRQAFLANVGPGDVVVTSYNLLLRHAEDFASVQWNTLILDEAQFIKNSRTKTARAVRELQADWRLALTGTPVENHLGELWSIFRAVSPGLFGSWDRFRQRFVDPITKHKETHRRHALSRVIRPFVLRRTKSEVLTELPQRTEVQLTAELSKDERKLYEDARLWAVTHLNNLAGDPEKARFQVLAALTRLRQLACHPRLVDDQWDKSSAKLDLLLETVDELREGNHRALVFSQFTQHLALIREALDEQAIPYQYLDGGTTAKQRAERIDAFQRGEGDLFLISLKAGGTGLNLTAADYVIHMDPWWNPAVEDQATDRAHRIGQTRPVMVYRLVAKDTIEEQILALHAEKRDLVAGVLEGSDQAARMSNEELIELIRSGGRHHDEPETVAANNERQRA